MAKVLILGITGGFGGYVAQALAGSGWSLRALMRNPAQLPQRFGAVETITGSAANRDDIRKAAMGVDLIVYAVNPANYQWEGKALPWLENAATVAVENRLTLVFPGNVYVFDPADGPEFREDSPVHPPTAKGKMRVEMEARLQQASNEGARVIIVRCGDFIGKEASSTWIRQLIKPQATGYTLYAPGPTELPHTWAYLPDVAQTVAELITRKDTLRDYEVFHFKGHRITFKELAAAIEAATGQPVSVKKFPWWALRLTSPFSPLFRSLVEMRYLWQYVVNLSDEKLTGVLGKPPPHTPLENALMQSGAIRSAR